MNLWLAAITATLFACCGIGSGYYASRLPKSYWTLGYLLPAAVVLVYGLASHLPALAFTPPDFMDDDGPEKIRYHGFCCGNGPHDPAFTSAETARPDDHLSFYGRDDLQHYSLAIHCAGI